MRKYIQKCKQLGPLWNCFTSRQLSSSTSRVLSQSKPLKRSIGQPTSHSHPFLMKEDEVTPSLTKQDYKLRRNKLISSLCSANIVDKNPQANAHAVIMLGEPITYMSEDIPYPFHQNTNFRYLTGFLEPESCLILETFPNGSSTPNYKSTLLVPERDVSKELWHGPRAGTEGALHHTGVDETGVMESLDGRLEKLLSDNYTIWYDFKKPSNQYLHMKLMRPFLTKVFDKKMNICPVSDFIHRQRLVKCEKEIFLMSQAARITAEAFKRVMPVSYPGMNEGAIQALIDCECRLAGAQILAYPPVVAGGNRANTLHYIFNNQNIKDGDLVLVDAGAEFHGYVADITRTWPINGRFSPAQRILYEAVLKVQRACIQLCTVGSCLQDIYQVMAFAIGKEMVDAKVFKEDVKQEELVNIGRRFCPHHVGHWLGMDVHDTDVIVKSSTLQEGMVVTVEPGIYVRDDDTSVHDEFRGIGIRIEDDVLVTSSVPTVLTEGCPKEVDEIEKLING